MIGACKMKKWSSVMCQWRRLSEKASRRVAKSTSVTDPMLFHNVDVSMRVAKSTSVTDPMLVHNVNVSMRVAMSTGVNNPVIQ